MDELEKARETIDGIDRQMAVLFEARMNACADVAAYKRKLGLPVLDGARERLVLEKNSAYLRDSSFVPYYENFMKNLMDQSKAYQRTLIHGQKVAYQGVEGAFSHLALKEIFDGCESVSYPSFEAVFQAVEKGEAACGVLPFENSYTGEVGEILDLLYAYPCCITRFYDLKVNQDLLGMKGASLADIRQVYSHPQAISQCQDFLNRHGFEAIPYANTALAAKYVSECADPSKAAIGASQNAALYGLQVLETAVNTRRDNTTRFIVIARSLNAAGNRFNVLFTVSHEAGQLAKIMQVVGNLGFNLESIKSRPLKNVSWQYYFYMEIVGDVREPKTQELIDRLKQDCKDFKILGVYTL